MNISEIKLDMLVFCYSDEEFSEVDQLRGSEYIKLKKDDSGPHLYDPVSWRVSTDNGKLKSDRLGEEAMADWSIDPAFSKYCERSFLYASN